MKNKYIKISVAACLIAMTACTLDYDPLSEYSDVTVGSSDDGIEFKDRAEMLSQYEGMYRRMNENQEHWYLDYLLINESYSDNAYGGTTDSQTLPFENNAVDASSQVLERDWNRYLADIAVANRIICNIDDVPDPGFSTAEREQWKAEAKIYRAMIMFEMARFWGNFPVITTVAPDITSENIHEVYPLYYPEQNTVEEAYAQIEKDLTEALVYAPAVDRGNKTLLTKAVANTLLAKVYAEKVLRDYDKVIHYCDEVINDGFSLVTDYADLFGMNSNNSDMRMRNTPESILEIQYSAGNGNWVTWMFGRNLTNWNESFTWAKWVTPSRNLIKAFEDEKDEIRLNESVVYYSCNWSIYYPSKNYAFMYKCRSAVSSIIKLRLADVILLKAEALIMKESADLNGAAELINQVRSRVNLSPLTNEDKASKEAMIEALLKERRLELAFEGQRWFDLVRFEKVEEVMNAVFAKDKGRKPQVHPFTRNSYLLPIPQNVLDQNRNLKQNPGH